ncbi:MFS transporter [Lactobacillus taiwanensis]|uniref:MFS transporter n=1 Tax=Lactobacillus taiwanensis TaxID=508451 RepID=UPI000B99167C|nr:MFS transporter [Lactobacillus taiwanensis]MCR1916526.1 MFS transporter [Lactobacillus taiwanensis]OYR96040.1 MFS transporter [Lactobacillus taiwanensis]OYR98950.1 MFS transporter [Lactobacillus taiwanensis]OYS15581.1 MFS transporter [Lactobacillus taiwanensis]OYS20088.1 MFS transporter [Lactobacillus taiwanensis]
MNVFLKNRNYRIFSIASFLSSAGDILFYLAFMTYASKLQNYSLALSLIAISESIPRLFYIVGGYFADRTKNKYKNIVLAAVIRFILYGMVGFLLISNLSQWNLVIIIAGINLISDIIGTYSSGLVSPLIVNLVGNNEFAEAEGFTNGLGEIINISAQFIGSGLLIFLSYSNLAFINAFTFLLAGLLFANVGLKQRSEKREQIQLDRSVNRQNFITTLKSSYQQTKKEQGLLTIILVMAALNGSLGAMNSLVSIVMVANKSTMIISNYSFTLAIIGVVASCGTALGSIFGPQLTKKLSIFSITNFSIIIDACATAAVLVANIYLILPLFFLITVTASTASLKLTQWLVSSVDQTILASTIGLLNTIVMVAVPVMTTIFSTISGTTNVKYALVLLLVVEVIELIIAIRLSIKARRQEVEITTSLRN